MIEGPVDVSGSTVKVDTSQELENLYTLARRASDEEDQDSAAKYYEMILLRDPDSWEANFYSPLCLYKPKRPATQAAALAALHARPGVRASFTTSSRILFFRSGMVWSGMVWFGMVWFGMVSP